MRKKILKEIGETVNAKFRLIRVKSFLNFDFLSEQDASQNLPSLKALASTGKLDDYWFSLLDKGQSLHALAYLYNNDFAFVLLSSDEQVEQYLKFTKPRHYRNFDRFFYRTSEQRGALYVGQECVHSQVRTTSVKVW